MLKRWAAPAIVLVLMVLNVAHLRARDTGRNRKIVVERAWSLPFSGAQGAVFTVLAPGGRPVVVLQTPRELALVTPEGRLARSLPAPGLVALATGDLDGDGGDELVLLRRSPPRLEALNADLKTVWSAPLTSLPLATRVLAADLDADGRAEVVAGGPPGLEAFAHDGRALWSYRFPSPAAGDKGELRGLDDVRGGGGPRRVTAARRDGSLVVLDAAGHALVEQVGAEVRRLRAGDADGDRRDEVLVGRDSGAFEALGDDGRVRVSASLGEAVVELRKVDLDGRRETGEIALGGKRGAVKVLRGGRVVMWAEMGVRVSELAGVDTDGDGRDEIAVGCEDGSVAVFSAAGARLASFRVSGKPERILSVGPAGGARQILVAGGPSLTAYRLAEATAPLWYSPVLAGVLGVFGLALLFPLLRRVRPQPLARPAEGAELLIAPLRSAQARLEALIAAGHVSPEQAAERLEQLARQAAQAAAAPEPQAAAAAAPPPPPRVSPPPPPRRK